MIKSQHQLEVTELWLERFRAEIDILKDSENKHKLGTKLLISSYEEQVREFVLDIQDYKNSLEKKEPESCWRKIIAKFK